SAPSCPPQPRARRQTARSTETTSGAFPLRSRMCARHHPAERRGTGAIGSPAPIGRFQVLRQGWQSHFARTLSDFHWTIPGLLGAMLSWLARCLAGEGPAVIGPFSKRPDLLNYGWVFTLCASREGFQFYRK